MPRLEFLTSSRQFLDLMCTSASSSASSRTGIHTQVLLLLLCQLLEYSTVHCGIAQLQGVWPAKDPS